MTTTVVHCKQEPFDIYIGRGSIWGNPFKIGPTQDRDRVIELYTDYLCKSPELQRQLHTLRGKRLGCYCKPKRCHGDILAIYADFGLPQFDDDVIF
jgi:hypothetical protein